MQLGLPSSCQLASRMRDENGMVVADRWKVEDTSVFPTVDVLDRSINCRETEAMQSADRDEVDAKLMGAYAAYARGLTPMCVGVALSSQQL